MRDISEISFEEFVETLLSIEAMATENRTLFVQMLRQICQECKLAGEMLFFIGEIHNELGKLSSLAAEHHKVIVAIWLLLNDCKRPGITIH